MLVHSWHLFIYPEVILVKAEGWEFLKYGWPFVLVGIGLGGIAFYWGGLWSGIKSTQLDFKARAHALADRETAFTQQCKEKDRQLAEQAKRLQRQAEEQKQQEARIAAKIAEVKKYEQWLEEAHSTMEQKLKAAYAERDSARQRAKRVQEEAKARKRKQDSTE